MARLTTSKATGGIAREKSEPQALEETARELAARCGRPWKQTASRPWGRLDFVARCDSGMYAPMSVALDGKAFRVPLSNSEVQSRELRKRKLEPFFTAPGQIVCPYGRRSGAFGGILG
ncbi:MAG: hypothetical protein ACOYEP_12990 [Limnochordia bacterium]|jgi:hypothetical protein